MSPEGRNWIQQTIDAAVKNGVAHIEKWQEDFEAEQPDDAVVPLKFSEDERKKIVEHIRGAAERNATKDGKVNDFKYQEGLPTQAEFDQFLYICEHHRLNPLLNQIYFQKRKGRALHIISIDAYRLKAERTKSYMPSKATEFFNGKHETYYGPAPDHCITHCKRLGPDGTWHDIEQIAFFSEYKQTYSDGNLTEMWKKMGATMLEKCCEAKMLRKAWPDEFGGLYISEELDQAASGEAPKEGSNSAKADLENARKGSPNQGHGKGDTVRSSATQAAQEDKRDPAKHLCVNCIPVRHPRAKHDGEDGYGPCMEEGCKCPGFGDEFPAPVLTNIEVLHPTQKEPDRKVPMTTCEGRVIQFRNQNSKGELLTTARGAPYVSIRIHGLSEDKIKNPQWEFQCYDKKLHNALSLSLGENVLFTFSTIIDDGKKKAESKGVVWQTIEDVHRVGQMRFVEGKLVTDEQAQPAPMKAEDENQDIDAAAAQTLQREYVALCEALKLDPKSMFQDKLRYEMSSQGEIFDRETGEVYARPAH